jgi:hypothetical protein
MLNSFASVDSTSTVLGRDFPSSSIAGSTSNTSSLLEYAESYGQSGCAMYLVQVTGRNYFGSTLRRVAAPSSRMSSKTISRGRQSN